MRPLAGRSISAGKGCGLSVGERAGLGTLNDTNINNNDKSGAGKVLAAVLVAWVLAFAAALPAGAQTLEVLQLRYRSAEDIIPVLKPLLEPGGSLTGQDRKLFVRASPANIAQLREVLGHIDRTPRSLLISVRRDTRQDIERERLAADAQAGTLTTRGPSARPILPDGGLRVSANAGSSARGTLADDTASVRTLEGSSAFIAAGPEMTQVTIAAAGTGRRPWAAVGIERRALMSGFLVTPRIDGDGQVLLEITQQQAEMSQGELQTGQLATSVRGPLGVWLPLGSFEEEASTRQAAPAARQYSTEHRGRSVWVRVEVLDPAD